MTVNINFLNFGSLGPSGFSDTMANAPSTQRNVLAPPSDDWIYIVTGGDTPTAGAALGTYNFGVALAGGGFGLGMGDVSYAFTTYGMATGIAPIVTYIGSRYYKAKLKFMQITFDSVSLLAPVMGWMNFIDATGTGVAGSNAICHDAYTLRIDQQGLIQRWNSGIASPTTINANIGAANQNDVHRISIDQTVANQVTFKYTLNGVLTSTVTDNNAAAVTGLVFPFIGINQFSGGGPSGKFKNFSCGLGL